LKSKYVFGNFRCQMAPQLWKLMNLSSRHQQLHNMLEVIKKS